MADGSRPLHVYRDACIDGVGAAREQEQPEGYVRHIAYISRATLNSERHWTPLDLENGSNVWVSNAFGDTSGARKFSVFSGHKALESIGKVGDHNARVQRWVEFLTAFDYTLQYQKGSANGNADFPYCLPGPATEHDRTGFSSLTPVEDGGIFFIGACGFAPVPLRSLVFDLVGWYPTPRALFRAASLSPLGISAHMGHV